MSAEKRIPLHHLREITNGFSVDSRIGQGGYGDVYKGVYNGRVVAVKLLHVDMVQGIDDQQYLNEVGNLLRVKHPNIVQLLGYSYETTYELVEHNGKQRLSQHIYRVLCFEYLQGGSLDKRLYDQSFAPDWSTRYNIIKGISEGLNFLHECDPQIWHLDLKPANILLDSSMVPKLADFALSRLTSRSQAEDYTDIIIGTRKYMPPEFINEGFISPKHDVFSLGIVMIEIMAGHKSQPPFIEMPNVTQFMQEVLANWSTTIEATSKYRSEELHQVKICVELAIRCVDSQRTSRPTIANILDTLNKTEIHIPKRQVANSRVEPPSLFGGRGEHPKGILSTSSMDRQAITARSELELMLFDESAEAKPLPLSLLEHITSSFSDNNEIGYGGFARVYKGVLDNGMIAVKKLSKTLDIDEKKFEEELLCLMKTKHKNVVRFLGYCSDTQGQIAKYEGNNVLADVRQRLLCFEYLPNGSLDKQITDASHGLEWGKRFQIINGICDGLYYLHQSRIVHLDLKPANILLDDNMMPKIADFGLSRCFSEKQSWAIASKLIGTVGYSAPEWYGCKKITFMLDIYSLGIIIIDILTGEKGYPDIDNVLESWRNRLEKSQEDTQLVQIRVCTEIAIKCTDFNPAKRPNIQHIIDKLRAAKNADEFATKTGVSS